MILCSSIALHISFWAADRRAAAPEIQPVQRRHRSISASGSTSIAARALPTTTHGLLLISMLLVPLNFLAIAAFTLEHPPTDVLTLGGEFASLAIFAWLTYKALRGGAECRPARGHRADRLLCMRQLIVRRFAGAEMGSPLLWTLGLPPVVGSPHSPSACNSAALGAATHAASAKRICCSKSSARHSRRAVAARAALSKVGAVHADARAAGALGEHLGRTALGRRLVCSGDDSKIPAY